MEMNIPQAVTVQAPTQTLSNGQSSKSTNGAEFQQALVQQINGESTNGKAAAATVVGTVVKQESMVVESSTSKPGLTELMSMIDGLIEQLEASMSEDGEVKTDDEQLQQLEAALDQMTALLALLGLPVPVIQQMIPKVNVAEGSEPSEVATSAINVKSSLQDSLIQLQALLQQGNVKHVQQQEPTVLVAQQLQALASILEADASKKDVKSTSAANQLFTLQSAPQAEISTLLQRLSQQTAHPAFQAAAVSNDEQVADSVGTSTTVETVPLTHLGSQSSENMRGLASLASNTNAGASTTSFVMADEFADSMSGLIVKKFDLSTLNGISEAKIMLFPEHLGQVDVRITMQNGLLTAIFQTDTAMAKDMLDNQMAQLRAALQAQGLAVDKLEVSQGQTAAQLSQQQQGRSNNQQQFAQQSFSGDSNSNELPFETDLVAQASVQGLGFGRGINVKA